MRHLCLLCTFLVRGLCGLRGRLFVLVWARLLSPECSAAVCLTRHSEVLSHGLARNHFICIVVTKHEHVVACGFGILCERTGKHSRASDSASQSERSELHSS